MWLYTGIIASIFCLLASAGLAISSWSDAGPGLVVFALLTLFWAKMLVAMLRQTRSSATESAREQNLASESESQSDYEVESEPGAKTRPELGQKSEKRAGEDTEPVGSSTVFVPHWFLMVAIMLTAFLVGLAIIVPLPAK